MAEGKRKIDCDCGCGICGATREFCVVEGPGDRAIVILHLAGNLRTDEQFRELANRLGHPGQMRLDEILDDLRERFGFADAPWARDAMLHIVAYAHCGGERHRLFWRFRDSGIDVALEANGRTIVAELDPTWQVGAEPTAVWEFDLLDPNAAKRALPLDEATRVAGNAAELGRRIGSERRGRDLWRRAELPLGRQPTLTLRRDTYIFYVVKWCQLSLRDAAVRASFSDDDAGIPHRASRGNRRADFGESLSRKAVADAVTRVAKILA